MQPYDVVCVMYRSIVAASPQEAANEMARAIRADIVEPTAMKVTPPGDCTVEVRSTYPAARWCLDA